MHPDRPATHSRRAGEEGRLRGVLRRKQYPGASRMGSNDDAGVVVLHGEVRIGEDEDGIEGILHGQLFCKVESSKRVSTQ
jgi:hypothetical protein